MKKIKLNGHDIELYDGSITDLPAARFHKFNKMLLIDAGIGSDLSDLDNHLDRVYRFMDSSPDMAKAELDNLRQNVYLIQSEISPKHMAFCVLITRIDGQEVTDISDEALRELQAKTGNIPMSEITAQVEAVKKKIDEELSVYFPRMFEDSAVKEYYDKLRDKVLAVLDGVITGNDMETEIEAIDNWLITFSKPSIFQGEKSVEVEYDKQYESMCLTLSKNLNVEAKELSLLAYYNAFEYLKDMIKSQSKKGLK